MANQNGVDKTRKIKTVDHPVNGGSPKHRIERLKGNERRKVVVCSDRLHGVQIHWCASTRRSEPCYENCDDCPGCTKKKPIKRRFYLFVWECGLPPYFLELTEPAAAIMEEMLAGEDSYRGITIEFSRTPASNGRIKIRVDEYAERKANLPSDRSPLETLTTLWKWGRDGDHV